MTAGGRSPEQLIYDALDAATGLTVGEFADAEEALAALVAERDRLLERVNALESRVKNCDAECWETGNCSGYCGGEGDPVAGEAG